MSEVVPVLTDDHNHRAVPSVWRNTFSEIVEAFKEGDFTLARGIAGVRPISEHDAVGIAENIEDYGAQLASLPEDTWQTSVCHWGDGYWDASIDLYTIEEGRSDLVLNVRIHKEGDAYVFEVHFVYVP